MVTANNCSFCYNNWQADREFGITRRQAFATALFLGLGTPAVGADLPDIPVPVSDPAPYAEIDWAGLYAGIQGGYGWGDVRSFELDIPGRDVNQGPLNSDVDGFFGGVHAGYNFQSGMFVYGIEGDFEYGQIDGGWSWDNGDAIPVDIRWLGSVRARAGAGFDRLLVYATGGLAFANVEMKVHEPGVLTISDDEWTYGWTLGGGAEYFLTDRFSLRGEYRYTDLREVEISGDVFGGTFAYPHEIDFHAVRIGGSWHF